jgi:putative ABC transport system ATP-binding protein
MIELEGIRKVFNEGRPNEFVAVDRVHLKIETGKITVLKGPSGSGKTTLLSIIGCMSRPTAGRIRLDGKEITSLPERFLTEIRRNTFGFIFQKLNLIREITVLENILVAAYPAGTQYRELKKRAQDLLSFLDLSSKANFKTEWLSGGEAQRVCIARALINRPKIIIADEPTAHLDSKLSCEFMEMTLRLKSEGKTILISSHDPFVFDSEAVDRIVQLRDGRLIEDENPDRIPLFQIS